MLGEILSRSELILIEEDEDESEEESSEDDDDEAAMDEEGSEELSGEEYDLPTFHSLASGGNSNRTRSAAAFGGQGEKCM